VKKKPKRFSGPTTEWWVVEPGDWGVALNGENCSKAFNRATGEWIEFEELLCRTHNVDLKTARHMILATVNRAAGNN